MQHHLANSLKHPYTHPSIPQNLSQSETKAFTCVWQQNKIQLCPQWFRFHTKNNEDVSKDALHVARLFPKKHNQIYTTPLKSTTPNIRKESQQAAKNRPYA